MHELVKKWQNVPPSQNAEKILRERYYLKNREGEYLESSWNELSRRVARVIAEQSSLATVDCGRTSGSHQELGRSLL